VDAADDGLVRAASRLEQQPSDFRSGDNASGEALKTFRLIARGSDSRNRAHRNLMDVAHECVGKLTDRMACAPPASLSDTGERHSGETMEHLRDAHDHLISAGSRCTENASEEQDQGSRSEPKKASPLADLAKVLADERAEKSALVKALGEMVPMLDRLSRRVDDIACTPLPPLTIARGCTSVSKQQDGSGTADIQLSPEALASALAKMSKEEQTLTLIKASYANPIRVLGQLQATPDQP
jgi:hypothetical protein